MHEYNLTVFTLMFPLGQQQRSVPSSLLVWFPPCPGVEVTVGPIQAHCVAACLERSQLPPLTTLAPIKCSLPVVHWLMIGLLFVSSRGLLSPIIYPIGRQLTNVGVGVFAT